MNLHGAVKESLRIQREFYNLVEKSGESYIFGKQFIAEQAIGILDILDRIIFYINALSDGGDIDLFLKLDKLRAEMNKCFAPDADVESMMDQVIGLAAKRHVSNRHVSEISIDECVSAHDLILHCYHRIFKVLENIIREVKTNNMGMIDFKENTMEIALNWLYSIKTGENNNAIDDDIHTLNYNSGVTQFIDGVNDVMR
ncbi:MAG: hypothetical protein GF307_00010, partial [candidate division Zixibacteria bacterium]|nr:hypothetical protein [candidate division Zixibacteria bacterium]